MAEEVDATFPEVFSEMSLTDLVSLLPWCISTAASPDMIPICYMSEACNKEWMPQRHHCTRV